MKFIMQTLRQGHLMCFLFLLCTLSPSPATPDLSQSFDIQSVCHWTCMVLLCVIHSYSPTSQPSPPHPPGYPSNPSMPVVSVVGSSVSIQLSTRYPGTNARGQFRFSLNFSAASTAKRQSLQPTEVQVDPTGLDTSVTTTHTLTDVVAGSYGVSVMAVNENGMSQNMTTTFVVQGMQCEHNSTSI